MWIKVEIVYIGIVIIVMCLDIVLCQRVLTWVYLYENSVSKTLIHFILYFIMK